MANTQQTISVGQTYAADVSGRRVMVRVETVNNDGTYGVLNLTTNRRTTFKSRKRFIQPVLATRDWKGQPATQKPATLAGMRARAKQTTIAASNNNGNASHVIIVARAGTGKTTTGIGALNVMMGQPFEHTPSQQQQAIFDAFAQSKGVSKIAMVAFNKSIATELQNRVPNGVDAMTMHSMGLKAVRRAITLRKGRNAINSWNVRNILEDIMGRSTRKIDPVLVQGVEALVGLCKTNLVGQLIEEEDRYHVDPDQLDELSSRFDILLNGHRARVYDLVPQILYRCAMVEDGGSIDFNDMIWLPIIRNLPVFKYDLLFVDEAQDLNPCQQALAIKAGKRLIFCGDDKQAIYGFTGADSESLNTLYNRLSNTPQGCVKLPLTVTRRCGKAIVTEAQRYVPDFEAHPTNGEGSIARMAMEANGPDQPGYRTAAQAGDMVLCRTNAPLVQQCFAFLKEGRKAQIQGRDIGKQLETLIKKMKATSPTDLIEKIELWREKETTAEQAKKRPSESRLISISDKADCVLVFASEADSVEDVLTKLGEIFSDKAGAGILLSSVHKAKGLEAETVYVLMPKQAPMPHPMARQPWAREQEYNILYVAITRAIKTLVFVS